VAMAGALAVVSGALVLKLSTPSSSAAKAAGVSMVPLETILPSAPKEVAPPVASVVQEAANAKDSLDAVARSESARKLAHEHKAPGRSARATPTSAAPLSSLVQPVASPSAPVAGAAAAPAPNASSPSTNTSGRGAFGGRH